MAAATINSTVSFDEPAFTSLYGSTTTILAAPDNSGGGGPLTVSYAQAFNIWNDATGAEWTAGNFGTRPGSDGNDLTLTFTLKIPTGYDADATASGGVGFDLQWVSGGTFTWNHKTASAGVQLLQAGQEVQLTTKLMLASHITALASQWQGIRATSQNGDGASGFEYGHLGLLDGAGNRYAGEAPEVWGTGMGTAGETVTAPAIAPVGWAYRNSRTVINPNGTAAATAGPAPTPAADGFDPINGSSLVNSTTAAAGFVVESYFQGVDTAPNIAVGGSFSSSVNEFTLNGAAIMPLVPETSLGTAGMLVGLTAIGWWMPQRPRQARRDLPRF